MTWSHSIQIQVNVWPHSKHLHLRAAVEENQRYNVNDHLEHVL